MVDLHIQITTNILGVIPIMVVNGNIAKSLVVDFVVEHNAASIIELKIVYFQKLFEFDGFMKLFSSGYFKRAIMAETGVALW